MATKKPTQKSVLYIDSAPYQVLNRVPSFLTSERWRMTAAEPTNAAYQGHLIRALKLSYKFVPRRGEDPKSAKITQIVDYYNELFERSNWDVMKAAFEKDSYDLPFGGALEIGWWPDNAFGGKFPAGYPAWIVQVDAGTMAINQARSNGKYPFCQIDPNDTQRIIPFQKREIARLIYLPQTSLRLRGYQRSPVEQNFAIIQALARLFEYDMKTLSDTPIAGILDLADFSEADAIEWAKGFQEMMSGIESIKIPILYEHEKPARFIPFGDTQRDSKEQWKHYAEKCGNPYGLTIGSLGLYEHDRTLAGARIQRITTQRTGVGGFAWDEKNAINRQLFPPGCPVKFDWDVPEIEDVVKRRQAEGIRIAYLGQMVQAGALKPEDMLEQSIEDDIFTIPVKPGAVEEGITGAPKPPKEKEVPPKAPKPGGKYPDYPPAEKAAHVVENTLLLKQDVGDELEQSKAFKDMQKVLTDLFAGLANKGDVNKLVGKVYRGKSEVVEMGGPGSGHHGHAGRKGKRGGSAPRKAGGLASKLQYAAEMSDRMAEIVQEDLAWRAYMREVDPAVIVSEVEEKLTRDLAQPIAIRRGLRGATSVVEDGRFKTQFETGKSGGNFDPEMRQTSEKKGLGVPNDLPNNQRPVYGYFRTDEHTAGAYGPIEFILKDSAKERATYTLGDSLHSFNTDMQVGGKSPSDQGGWNGNLRDYLDHGAKGVLYVEAQVQGGISLGDVAKVVIHGSPSIPEYKAMQSALGAKGIKVEFDESTQ